MCSWAGHSISLSFHSLRYKRGILICHVILASMNRENVCVAAMTAQWTGICLTLGQPSLPGSSDAKGIWLALFWGTPFVLHAIFPYPWASRMLSSASNSKIHLDRPSPLSPSVPARKWPPRPGCKADFLPQSRRNPKKKGAIPDFSNPSQSSQSTCDWLPRAAGSWPGVS